MVLQSASLCPHCSLTPGPVGGYSDSPGRSGDKGDRVLQSVVGGSGSQEGLPGGVDVWVLTLAEQRKRTNV